MNSQGFFEDAKQRFLCFSEAVKKANSAEELRALLMADTEAPYHSYDMLELMDSAENIGLELCFCMSETLDDDGIPGADK